MSVIMVWKYALWFGCYCHHKQSSTSFVTCALPIDIWKKIQPCHVKSLCIQKCLNPLSETHFDFIDIT
jgi:hypothetical protein